MQENKWYTAKPEFKEVSKEEFLSFLKTYPRNIISDFFMDTVSYNDFELADKWPYSIIATKNLGYFSTTEDEDTIYRICVNHEELFTTKTGYTEDSVKQIENLFEI